MRRLSPKDLIDAFGEHGLMLHASAIAFRVLFALPPFILFVLAVLGLLSLGETWTKDVAPNVKESVSPEAFALLDKTILSVLSSGRLFWLTVGLALTVWALSGAVRAAQQGLDEIYGCHADRPFLSVLPMSLWVGSAIGLCVVGALGVVRFGPLLVSDHGAALSAVSFVVRYAVAALLLALAVGLLVRHAAGTEQPLGWVSFGSGLVVVGWIVVWTGYALYLRYLADHGSAFGAFASIVVLLGFLQVSAVVLLGGTLLDSLVREQATGQRDGS